MIPRIKTIHMLATRFDYLRWTGFLLILSQLFFCPQSLCQLASKPTLSELVTQIEQRDRAIVSMQMFGVLEKETSPTVIEDTRAAIVQATKRPMHGTPVQSPNETYDVYYAFSGEKEALINRRYSGKITGQALSVEAQQKLREEMFQDMPIIYDGRATYFLSLGTHSKTVKMKEGDKDTLFGDSRSGFRPVLDDHQPFAALLKQGKYKIVGYEADARFGSLVHLRGETGTGNTIQMWLAPERSGLIMKEELSGTGNNTFEVNEVEQHGDLWIPRAYTYSVFKTVDGKPVLVTRSKTTYTQVSLNDVPVSVCEVKLNPGDLANDVNTGQWWTVGQNGERLYQKSQNSNEPATLGFGWLYMTSVTTLLVLTIGAYVRWKQKQWAKSR